MPFDLATFPLSDQAADPTALYRKRREDAAALWATVPVERFDIRDWQCGTKACALGYLGLSLHDGWSLCRPSSLPLWNRQDGFYAAAVYFGLALRDAYDCFGLTGCSEDHYGKALADVTPTDVARTLLALPYTLPTAA